jgi:hypothetical protein
MPYAPSGSNRNGSRRIRRRRRRRRRRRKRQKREIYTFILNTLKVRRMFSCGLFNDAFNIETA